MAGTYLKVTTGLNIFVDPANHRRICIWTASPGETPFRDESGGKPGFRLSVSADPLSADYDPANYNRFLRALHQAGMALEVMEVPLRSRRLRDRWGLVEGLAASALRAG